MKKTFIFIFCFILGLSFIQILKSLAEEITSPPESTTTTTTTSPTTTTSTPLSTTTTFPATPIQPLFKGIKAEDLKQSLIIQEKIGWRLGQTQNMSRDNTTIHIKAGKLTEIGESLIKVEIFGYTYKVDISKANLFRQGWGKSEIDEFSIGDVINVYGYLDEKDNFLIHAINVRDMSILLTHYVFKGIIKSLDTPNKTFVLNTKSHGDLTVGVYSDTKIIKFTTDTKPYYIEGAFSDLIVNEPVIVRGIYNINQKKIDANLIIVGSDERPFFKNQMKLKENFKNQGQFSNEVEVIKNSLKEQIQNLQHLLQQLKKGGS
ncbi:MAG: hypothetical protein N2323_06595 [candidate division WOR-3 bacterium]|nr:hypothetical protein [candidate division WOR-3 bacterium]